MPQKLLFVSLSRLAAEFVGRASDYIFEVLIEARDICIAYLIGYDVDGFVRLIQYALCVFDARTDLFLLERHVVAALHDAVDLLFIEMQFAADLVQRLEAVFRIQRYDRVQREAEPVFAVQPHVGRGRGELVGMKVCFGTVIHIEKKIRYYEKACQAGTEQFSQTGCYDVGRCACAGGCGGNQ